MKENCYKCKHRGLVTGSAHFSCGHPKNKNNFLGDPQALGIKAKSHGVKSGWFMWPWDFDPVWLENCNGFENNEEDD